MSFAFMPVYTGDYLRDTRHLSPMKHGIYFLLLAHCWDQKGPAPLDEQECAGIANCRSADEVEALRYVLTKYFVRMEDGWYNRRMQQEIERANAISALRSEAGKRGYQAKVKQLPSKCQASASTPTPTPTTTTTPTGKSKGKASQGSPALLPDWLKPEDWKAFVDHRRRLSRPMTEEAQRRAIAELGKLRTLGHNPSLVIEQSLVRGWMGLFPVKDQPASTAASQAERVAKILFQDPQPDGEIIDG